MPDARTSARAIWQAGVDAVQPQRLIRSALTSPQVGDLLASAARIIVVGGGKAGAAMSVAVEAELAQRLGDIQGVVNVPNEVVRPLKAIRLHAARPAGSNQPTEAGATGTAAILDLVRGAGPEDVVLCLLSGGGSALLPAPAEGISLADKQHVTQVLHACGASINEMNAVRKHLSRIKGGGLAAVCRCRLITLILSDVVGDPLDVIASGPTAADPTTFADALAVLQRYDLLQRAPPAVVQHLRRGAAGAIPETLKELPGSVHNLVIGSNTLALTAAAQQAEQLGYQVLNLGPFIEGETHTAAIVHAGIIRSIRALGQPAAAPLCLLSGGETTVTLGPDHGRGGRNQEFVLAALHKLELAGMSGVVILSGGTDGEDGPTDAAGALGDADTLHRARLLNLDAADFLARHNAYHFFDATHDLLKTGLTQTNVMDLRVILIQTGGG